MWVTGESVGGMSYFENALGEDVWGMGDRDLRRTTVLLKPNL